MHLTTSYTDLVHPIGDAASCAPRELREPRGDRTRVACALSGTHARGMRVAVIGAGASGLVALKWLRQEGLDATCFERSQTLGGIWNDGEGWPSYRSLVANVSREKTSLSDHPLRSTHDYPPRKEIHTWLAEYADRFDLRRHIHFGHQVGRVEPRWTVDGEGFDAVVVASGMFGAPFQPELPGTFSGRVLHSRDYNAPEPFAGMDVVVAGSGSSAADIAVELSRVSRVSLSFRALATTPKTIGGRPIDRRQTRFTARLPARLRSALTRRVILDEWRRRDVELARVPPNVHVTPLAGRAPTPSEELLPALVNGRVRPRPAILRLDGDGVVFSGGTRERADAIVLATGYAIDLPFLPRGLAPLRDGRLEAYRHVFHADEPTLAFIGFTRVSGPVPPIAEVQARWVARVFAGRAALPAPDEMRAEIRARVEHARRTGSEFQRVQYVEYLDDIAGRLGAKPRWWRDPFDYWFGVVTAERYR